MFNRVFICVVLTHYLAMAQFLGPGTIVFKRFEECAPNAEGVFLNISINRLNRTHNALNLYLDFGPYILDNSMTMNLTVSKWGDGGWKPHAFDYYEKNPCEFFFKYLKDEFTEILKLNNKPIKCPFPSGVYTLKNYVISGNFDVPLIYGEFRCDSIFMIGSKLLTCTRSYFTNEKRRLY